MMYVGIDPGESAGFALITGAKTVIALSSKVDLPGIFHLLSKLKKNETRIGLEKVHAIWGASAKSTFTFGSNYGFWIGVLAYLDLESCIQDVTPKDWQETQMNKPAKPNTKNMLSSEGKRLKKLHKDAVKMESIRAATVAFPTVHLPSHDVADAVNIARYVRYKHEQEGTFI